MFQNLKNSLQFFYQTEIVEFFRELYEYPLKLVTILDIAIVVFLVYKAVKLLKNTRAWQLLKGIAILIIITVVSGWLKLSILNYILSSVMMYRSIYTYSNISART